MAISRKNNLLVLDSSTGIAAGGAGSVTGLTAGRVAFALAADALADDADFTFSTDTLTVTKLVVPTSVGIGTGASTTFTAFHVADTSTSSPRGIMSSQHSTSTDSAIYTMRKSRGTLASPTVIVTADVIGRISFAGYDGANYIESTYIRALSTGTIASTRVPTQLEFYTGTDAAPTVATLALTITTTQGLLSANVLGVPGGTSGGVCFDGQTVIANSTCLIQQIAAGVGGNDLVLTAGLTRGIDFAGRSGAANTYWIGINCATGTLVLGRSNASAASWTTAGVQFQTTASTYTNSSTAGSGTAATAVFSSFAIPTLAATNSSVTTTDAATVYIAGAPAQGTNQTITNTYALWIDAGAFRLDGTDGAGALTATITNAPKVGNPTNWIPIKTNNGTALWFPAWSL